MLCLLTFIKIGSSLGIHSGEVNMVGGESKGVQVRPFDPWGWDYKIGKELARQFFPKQAHLLEQFGGKVFGLAICDLLSRHEPALQVPRWRPVTKIIKVKQRTIFRSCAFDEDFLNGEAGVHQSFVLEKGQTFNPADYPIPFVAQEFKPGVGIVVDIAWSEVEKALVGRVATGRLLLPEGNVPPHSLLEGEEVLWRCTSGTNDPQGHAIAWKLGDSQDPWKAELIGEHGGRNTHPHVRKVLNAPLKETILVLLRALRRAGITFGVQAEFQINPFERSELWLVQIRPSPLAVRGHSQPAGNGTVLAQSSTVSGAFSVSGELVVPTLQERGYSFAHSCLHPDWMRDIGPRFRGKVLFVPGMLEAGPGRRVTWLRHLRALQCRGIVASDSIGANTSHYSFEPNGPEVLRELQLLSAVCPSMRTSRTLEGSLGNLTTPGIPVRMLSDGLMGRLVLPIF